MYVYWAKMIITRGPFWFPETLQKSFVKAKISSMMFSVGIKVDESGQVGCDEISVILLLYKPLSASVVRLGEPSQPRSFRVRSNVNIR